MLPRSRHRGRCLTCGCTMAGVLTVTRPHMNGPGGDVFMIYYDAKTKKVYTLNGAGRAGSKATPALFASRDLKEVPQSGILSVSVPGTPQAWADALQRFGTIPLSKALERKFDWAIEQCELSPGKSVLEIGPGWGAFASHALQTGVRFTGSASGR